ncbi:hypothetical protein ACIQT7_23375, partial [Agrobacterium deltaense]
RNNPEARHYPQRHRKDRSSICLIIHGCLSRNLVDARLRGERVLSAQGLGLAGFRLKAGMTVGK